MPIKRELIYINDKDETERVVSYSIFGNKCVIVFKNNDTKYTYNKDRVKIVKTAISEEKANDVFIYLNRIADAVGLKTDEGDNILAKSYQKISVIPKDCILANYLNGKNFTSSSNSQPIEIFPFGFNLSQKEAVSKVFLNPMNVIEGPPGTGKTQTILNIIANAVINGKSVAVVSSNNSATKNVYDKLEKNGINFIAALLGNTENKKEFIVSQTDIPDLSEYRLSEEEKDKKTRDARTLFHQLTQFLSIKNELALCKQELDDIETEYNHFNSERNDKTIYFDKYLQSISADKMLEIWLAIKTEAQKGYNFGFIKRLIFRFKYGIKDKSFYQLSFEEMIFICQSEYYPAMILELTKKKERLEHSLAKFSFESKMSEYTKLSMHLFKAELNKRYDSKERGKYAINELRSKSSEFIEDYPVVMSTTYSLRQSLSDTISYDYVIIDEASQVDIATGALALSCAKRAVIVGDLKQLPNVVDSKMEAQTNLVFDTFNLSESYRYSKQSLLSSIIGLFPNVPKTLLKEHYRCHPKIIDFCNKKFYNNELIILTEPKSDREPLIVYKTPPGNHARERMNQRQIDIIKHEIIPNEHLDILENNKLGIVTPYRNQTDALQKAFKGTKIKADTVDKFQGRENDVIILSTVDNEISEFTDNPNRLNVAVSRAIEQLILVVNGNESDKDSNIADLIRFIEYNNFSVVNSNLSSIFDCLYKGYEIQRAKIISKSRRVSEYDSENLMHALIKEVLTETIFSKNDVRLHFSLRNLIRDYSLLSEQEQKYARNPLTHLDFLIYNKLGKIPVLAIEVDGFEFHKDGTQQAKRDRMKDVILEKYGLPLLRFATTGSNEKLLLRNKLIEVQNINDSISVR